MAAFRDFASNEHADASSLRVLAGCLPRETRERVLGRLLYGAARDGSERFGPDRTMEGLGEGEISFGPGPSDYLPEWSHRTGRNDVPIL
jgi:hypothetical protein